VEPKYEKELQSFDDLLHSDVVYSDQPLISYVQDTFSYPEFVTFLEHKTLREDYSDLQKYVERMITKKDIASLLPVILAKYVAMQLGTVDVGKVVCTLGETLISAGSAVGFKKGNPLLDRFNVLMRRYLEAGLQEMIWSELQHRASLKGGERFTEAAGDIYFPFAVSHLKPAFVVLLVGAVLSSVVFIGELTVNCLCERRGRKVSRVRRVRVLC
jgi:hypothetical protein